MSKHEDKLEQKSPAKPESVTKDGELSDEQLKDISGGTRKIDKASPVLTMACSEIHPVSK